LIVCADHDRHVDVGRGGDLAGDDGHARLDHGLAGDTGGGILGDETIEDGVGDLIAHLVGMAFGDGLGRELVAAHEAP
jgi:hypothetical protein